MGPLEEDQRMRAEIATGYMDDVIKWLKEQGKQGTLSQEGYELQQHRLDIAQYAVRQMLVHTSEVAEEQAAISLRLGQHLARLATDHRQFLEVIEQEQCFLEEEKKAHDHE